MRPPRIAPTAAARTLALDPAQVSLKRAAWAYGCAKKGSEEERLLLALLLDVAARETREKPVPGRDCPPWECVAHEWDESNSTPCAFCYPPGSPENP